MDCLDYSDANELFSELVNDINGACAIDQNVQVGVSACHHRFYALEAIFILLKTSYTAPKITTLT